MYRRRVPRKSGRGKFKRGKRRSVRCYGMKDPKADRGAGRHQKFVVRKCIRKTGKSGKDVEGGGKIEGVYETDRGSRKKGENRTRGVSVV